MSDQYQISAVLPAHNEVDNLALVVQECLHVLKYLTAQFEVIIVDDGSTDGTAELADRLAGEDPRVRVIHHPRNMGYGSALRSGFAAAAYPLIFFTDADRQFEIKEITKLLPHLERSSLVAGFREKRQDPPHRVIYSFIFSWLIRRLFSVQVRDVNCAFKVFQRSLLEGVELKSPGALINAELLAICRLRGVTPIEVPVTHLPRVRGKQSGGSARVILRAVRELIDLKRRYP